jgi:hypothetical protein
MKCVALFELVAGNPVFGNYTKEELTADANLFYKNVCDGGYIKQAQDFLNKQIGIAETFIASIQAAMQTWCVLQFNLFIEAYNVVLKSPAIDMPTKLEKLDIFTECAFGLCSIGNTVTNYKNDVVDRLYLTPNGQANRARFKKILLSGINKINGKLTILGKDITATQDAWHKIAKDTISHN